MAAVSKLKDKKVLFCPIWDASWKNCWGINIFDMRSLSLQEPRRSTQNYNLNWAFRKKCPSSRDIRTFLQAFLGKTNKKQSILRRRICKIEDKNAPRKFSASLLYSRFNVDHDLAIKHVPIQSYDWVMDISAIPKLHWAPKIMIIPQLWFQCSRWFVETFLCLNGIWDI